MRITEHCRCGATIEIVCGPYEAPPRVLLTEDTLGVWRERHQSCLPSHPALSAALSTDEIAELHVQMRGAQGGQL